MLKAIAYYRVSTDRQGKSGLGLEAQQEAVRLFADRQGYQVTAHFTESSSYVERYGTARPDNSSLRHTLLVANRVNMFIEFCSCLFIRSLVVNLAINLGEKRDN